MASSRCRRSGCIPSKWLGLRRGGQADRPGHFQLWGLDMMEMALSYRHASIGAKTRVPQKITNGGERTGVLIKIVFGM